MNVIIVFILIFVLLFIAAFITKRRFGVLGLALAVGSQLSGLWAVQLTLIIRNAGLDLQEPPLGMIVSVALIILPSIILLFSGPKYRDMPKRIIGALVYASLAFVFLIEPLGTALVLQDQGKLVYDFVAQNRVYIVTAGLIIAIIDLVSTRTPKVPKPDKH